MTVKEMHIELNQSLQKIASNTTRKYLNEELDWVLNKMMWRFVQNKLSPKTGRPVTLEQLQLDGLRKLIVIDKVLPAYVVDKDSSRSTLPGDYVYLLSDSSNIIRNCVETPVVSNVARTYTILTPAQSSLSSPSYYLTASMTVGTTTMNIPSGLSVNNEYSGYKSKSLFELIAYYIGVLREENYNVYWENCGTIRKPGSFIIEGNIGTLGWEVDGVQTVITSTETINSTRYSSRTNEERRVNRLTNPEIVQNLLNTPFYKSSTLSPVSVLYDDFLQIYNDTNFRVSSSVINYVRKPKRISLALGVDCEIAEGFHQTICDMATEYIKGRQEDGQGKQLITEDLETRVIL